MLKCIEDDPNAHNVQFELLPAMYVVCDIAAIESGKNRKEFAGKVMSEIRKLDECRYLDVFNNRVNLYGQVVRGKQLRAEWLLGNNPDMPTNPIQKIAIALGDVMINPHCPDNYEDAPLLISDVFSVLSFSEAMKKVFAELNSLYNDVCKMEG